MAQLADRVSEPSERLTPRSAQRLALSLQRPARRVGRPLHLLLEEEEQGRPRSTLEPLLEVLVRV